MRNQIIQLEDIAELATSIAHYQKLPGMFTQLDSKQSEKLKEFWDKAIKHNNEKRQYPDWDFMQIWNTTDLHMVEQRWSNTSCGWQGMGGSAFSSSYTIILVNYRLNIFFVYYHGKLAYVAHINEKTNLPNDIINPPGLRDAQKKLDLIYTYKY